MKKRRLFVAMLVALSLVFSSISATYAAAPVTGNVIVESVFADPMGLVPGWATDAMTSDIGSMLFAPLLEADKQLNLKPYMAESVTKSADGLSYTVKLKKGWKWHDGVEVTAEDLEFTYDMMLDPTSNCPRRQDCLDDKIKDVVAKDKYTAVFQLSSKNVWFEYHLSNGYMIPKHILKGTAPKDIMKHSYFKKPIGNGPMKFVEYLPGERIVFEQFKDYPAQYKPKTPNDKYIFQIVPSQATAILKAQTGEANFTYVPASDIPATKQSKILTVKDFPEPTIMYLTLNMKRPFFSDKRVRQAISYAINRDALSKGVYKGFYVPAQAYYPPVQWFHNPNVKKYTYDLAKAKQLLDQAGWKVGKNGLREKNGQPFKFTLLALKGNAGREKTCVFIQSSLRQLGIQVEVRSLEWNTLYSKYIDPKNFDAAYLALGQSSIPSPSNEFGKSGYFNNSSYYNPEVEKLCVDIQNVKNRDEAKKIMYRIQEIVQEELPVIVLLYPSSTYALAKNLRDVDRLYGTHYNPAEWHVAK